MKKLLPRTLYGRLVLALLALFAITGIAYVTLTIVTTRLHLQEVTQKLHRSIAANIVKEQWLMRGDMINKAALKEIFNRLMGVNPSIEVYLLDGSGRILSYSAPAEKIKRKRVSLAPIGTFLANTGETPIRGDDPRSVDGKKIFSVAPIYDSGSMAGFLYIVLGGEEFDSVVALFQRSQVLRLSAGITIAALLLTIVIGALSFNWLTRRLRLLSSHMSTFRRSGFTDLPTLPNWRSDSTGDEIDQLGRAFGEMSDRITEQIDQLKQADADRRDMVASISHDLRTPLASLVGYLETLALKDDTLTDEEKQTYLALAVGHGERLSRLIADLFELATLEATDASIKPEPFLINELANDIAQRFRLKAESKHLKLITDIPQQAPFVTGDIALIERVLENLIDNALKYTPENGAVTLALSVADGRITTRVSDTGPGIKPDDLPHIFDRFFQINPARGNSANGAGLGLAIAQRILQLHDGAITVESRPGHGTRFSFPLTTTTP